MFLRNIFEAMARTGEGKTAVVGWGRGMGHKGHMYLASSVITHANQLGADPYFVVSKTVGKDDPITPDEKIAIYKKVFPQSGHIFQPATDEIPDLTRVLANLNQQGYTGVTVVLGADQVKAFQYLKNYNNKPDKSGNILYNFDNLDVISRQETDDPSKDQEGPRATPMRQALMDPNKSEEEQFQVWRDAMSPQIGDDEVRDLMTKAKERMTAMSAPKPKKAKVAPVNELSSEKLGQYKKAAGAQASAADKAGDFKKADKRFSGIVKATKKQFANDEKSVGEARKKKPRNKDNLSKYFFPGYGYYGYGGSNDSGEGGGDSGGEGVAEGDVVPLGKKHRGDLDSVNSCSKCGGKLQGGTYMGQRIKVCQPCKQVYLPPNSGIDQQGNKIKEQGVAEGAPIVVMPRADRLKKAEPTKVRYQGDIVPPTKPPSTEKRGVNGRPGQRPMPDHSVKEAGSPAQQAAIAIAKKKAGEKPKSEAMLPKSAFAGSDKNKLGSAAHLKGSMKRPAKAGDLVGGMEEEKQRLDPSCWKGYRKAGTKMKGGVRVNNCVPVSEGVENIMDNLINKIIVNEAVQNNRK